MKESPEFTRFYRWGWLPLAGGSFLLCAVVIVAGDWYARARGFEVPRELSTLFAARALFLSFLVCLWSGIFVHRTRRRIEHAREQLLTERRRLEQTEGVAAILRQMAHEIRNPLNGVRLHTGVIRRAIDRGTLDSARESIAVLDTETKRLAELMDEYVELGRADETTNDLRVIDVRAPVRTAVETHRASLEREGISVALDLPTESLRVEADAAKLGEVVAKLMRNALEALRNHGEVVIRVRAAEGASIEVSDTGPGFADPDIAFRPFYSTKPEGTGLGLSVVHDFARAHRGEVSAFNNEAGGATVRIRLPLHEDKCAA